jgi:hypothetical protein
VLTMTRSILLDVDLGTAKIITGRCNQYLRGPCSLLASALVQAVVLTEVSTTYISFDVLRWILYRTPVGSLEKAVLCCMLCTKPHHCNNGAVLLHVCVAMGMLLPSNLHLQIGYRCLNVWEDSMEGSHTH